MLILTRNPGEKIIIGEGENRVEILYMGRHDLPQVALGITAPAHIPIIRLELENSWDFEGPPPSQREKK